MTKRGRVAPRMTWRTVSWFTASKPGGRPLYEIFSILSQLLFPRTEFQRAVVATKAAITFRKGRT